MTGQQLKNSILQLAVQGKLVPQDPADEPASQLLARIREEKEQLIREKKIKREKNPSHIFRGEDGHFYERVGKNEPVCIDEELPFEIPEKWEWARLGTIAYSRGQKKPTDIFCYIDIGSIDNVHQRLSDSENILLPEKAPSRARKIVFWGDILYATVRPYLHNMCIIDRKFSHDPIASTGFAVLTCHNEFFNKFLFYYMMSPDFDSYANDNDNSKGVAYPAINDTKLYRALIPVPPVKEQHNIVEFFEKTLPLIKQYTSIEQLSNQLNTTFPDQLKKSILQEAIQGNLVAQNPADEPASALLERIRAEKDQLIKDGKIKREKNPSQIFRGDDGHFYERIGKAEPVFIDDQLPFEIPESWEWARLGSIVNKLTDGTHSTPHYIPSGIPFISVKDVSSGQLDLSNCKYISKEEHDELYERCNPEYGDILLTKVGTTGVPAIVNTHQEFSMFVSVALLKFNQKLLCNKYLRYSILSPLVQEQANQNTRGVGNKNWVVRDIARTLIPLPPLAEQQRIVAKIEQLLPLCERLS